MRVDIALEPSTVSITERGGQFPLLVAVGSLHIAARSGDPATGQESDSIVVSINNAGKRASRILGEPLRKRAWVYDDEGVEFCSGIIAQVGVGNTLDLTIEG
jgi:hypothetical protein